MVSFQFISWHISSTWHNWSLLKDPPDLLSPFPWWLLLSHHPLNTVGPQGSFTYKAPHNLLPSSYLSDLILYFYFLSCSFHRYLFAVLSPKLLSFLSLLSMLTSARYPHGFLPHFLYSNIAFTVRYFLLIASKIVIHSPHIHAYLLSNSGDLFLSWALTTRILHSLLIHSSIYPTRI